MKCLIHATHCLLHSYNTCNNKKANALNIMNTYVPSLSRKIPNLTYAAISLPNKLLQKNPIAKNAFVKVIA